MKTNAKLIILLLAAAMTVGCAKESKKGSGVPVATVPPGGGPYIPPGTGPGQNPGTTYGGSAPLSIVSVSTLSTYTGRPMNNPSNIRINLNMIRSGSAWAGTATVTYNENGYAYQGYFTTGSQTEATKYNVSWTTAKGKVWHGIFEDFLGGLVVVIDGIVDLGDGAGPQDNASGSVWFKNFGLTYAPHPPTYCWFVSRGPYDCRAWPDGSGMNTYQSVNPGGGYTKLGTFTGMSIKGAFNNQGL
jgi:hypothetical protein